MGTFSVYVQLALAVVFGALLKPLLDSILNPVLSVGCGANIPDVATDVGARNCAYLADVSAWFLALVLAAMFVFALSRSVVAGRVGV
jgi:hypothetical protein